MEQVIPVDIDELDVKQRKIDELNERLKDAIVHEKYEEASHIRDEIQKLIDKKQI